MLELFSAETTIVVGLDLDEGEDNILQTAMSLAQKTGSRLILVNAVQPFRSYAMANEGFALPYEEFGRETYDNELKSAEIKLNAIRDRIPPEIVVETSVFRDYPESALEAVAMESKASLIICGMRSDPSTSLLTGMSTALALMAQADVPVMILPQETSINFASHQHNILVADNLKNEGLYALKAALGLCKSISYKQLTHVHVENMSYRSIHQTVAKIKVAMIEGRLENDPDFNIHRYLERIKSEIKEFMHMRLAEADPDFAKGLRYQPRVRFGQPAEEIHKLVRELGSDMLIFGKHHFLRPRGLIIGKIPYQSMIESNVATLVVPEKVRM